MTWLYGISITCFAASYLVAFCLELTRVFFRAPLRKYLINAVVLAGFFAHSTYMVLQTQVQFAGAGLFLGSWSGWCFGAAWLLIVAYLWVRFRQPQTLAGLFVLPMVICLIGAGTWLGQELAFPANEARTVWNAVHGLSLLVGTATVILGFTFGIMYLLQSTRLKKKRPPSRLVRYPSLEWLQESSETLLLVSTVMIGVGLLSGVLVNVINQRMGETVLPWNDPVIISSAILFTWLLISLLFNLCYRPARQGRKVAYLVVASFLFLVVELGIVLYFGHATRQQESAESQISLRQEAALGKRQVGLVDREAGP
ncbi:MAG: cytochrome c biogenesis protein CcsA [Mariniblastus sp.]|nr:cytochrome c biogenesis protein CcsA [Mariniblastus sp.]